MSAFAQVFADSMAHYTAAFLPDKYDEILVGSHGQVTVDATAGPRGGPALRFHHIDSADNGREVFCWNQKNFAAQTEYVVGVRIYVDTTQGPTQGITGIWTTDFIKVLDEFGTVQGGVRLTSTGFLSGIRGGTTDDSDGTFGTNLGTASTPILFNRHYGIVLRYLVDGAAGSIEVWAGATKLLNITAANTKGSGASANIGSVVIGNMAITISGASGNPDMVMSDYYVSSGTTVVNNIAVIREKNNADSTVAWTKNGGATNVSRITEEPPDDDTTYNESTANGTQDTFVHDALPAAVNRVVGVTRTVYAKNIAGGTGKIHTIFEDENMTDIELPAAYAFVQGHTQTRVATGLEFTPTEANAALAGYKDVS